MASKLVHPHTVSGRIAFYKILGISIRYHYGRRELSHLVTKANRGIQDAAPPKPEFSAVARYYEKERNVGKHFISI